MFLFFSIHALLLTVINTAGVNTTNQEQHGSVIYILVNNNVDRPIMVHDYINEEFKELTILLNEYTKQSLVIIENINEWLSMIRNDEINIIIEREKHINIISLIREKIDIDKIKQAQALLQGLVKHGYYLVSDSVPDGETNVYFNVSNLQKLVNLIDISYITMYLALEGLFSACNHSEAADQVRTSINRKLTNILSFIGQLCEQEARINLECCVAGNLKQAYRNFSKLINEIMLESTLINRLIELMMNENTTDIQFYECFKSSIKGEIVIDMACQTEEIDEQTVNTNMNATWQTEEVDEQTVITSSDAACQTEEMDDQVTSTDVDTTWQTEAMDEQIFITSADAACQTDEMDDQVTSTDVDTTWQTEAMDEQIFITSADAACQTDEMDDQVTSTDVDTTWQTEAMDEQIFITSADAACQTDEMDDQVTSTVVDATWQTEEMDEQTLIR